LLRLIGDALFSGIGDKFTTTVGVASINLRMGLESLKYASDLYSNLQGASIPLSIISRPIAKVFWSNELVSAILPTNLARRNRSRAFSCILWFESGGLNVSPSKLENVMAISSGNSIFASNLLFRDPHLLTEGSDIRRIIGNVGRAGITLMVPPREPRVRQVTDNYRIVQHTKYDFKREDNFRSTSLHLSFTQWEFAVDTEELNGRIDKEIFFVETIVSVYDHGQWVADTDILNIDESDSTSQHLQRLKHRCYCSPGQADMECSYVSVDSWDELLDPPEGPSIFRAHGNWAARLAATAILLRGNNWVLIANPNEEPCWKCEYPGHRKFFYID